MGVNVVEYDIEFKDEGRERAEVLADIREKLATIPGVFVNVGQPISHRLSHMLSGVSAKIAIKIFGTDIDKLQSLGQELQQIVQAVPGTTDGEPGEANDDSSGADRGRPGQGTGLWHPAGAL